MPKPYPPSPYDSEKITDFLPAALNRNTASRIDCNCVKLYPPPDAFTAKTFTRSSFAARSIELTISSNVKGALSICSRERTCVVPEVSGISPSSFKVSTIELGKVAGADFCPFDAPQMPIAIRKRNSKPIKRANPLIVFHAKQKMDLKKSNHDVLIFSNPFFVLHGKQSKGLPFLSVYYSSS